MNYYSVDDETIFESEYQRERTIKPPIGTPLHCFVNTDHISSTPSGTNKLNEATRNNVPTTVSGNLTPDSMHETDTLCPSLCNVEPPINRTPDIPEVPELSIPENVEMTDANVTSIQHNVNADALSDKFRSSVELNTTGHISDVVAPITNIPQSSATSHSNQTKISVALENNDEDPDEVREYPNINSGPSNSGNLPTAAAMKNEIQATASAAVAPPIEPFGLASNEANEAFVVEPHGTVTIGPNAEANEFSRHHDDDNTKRNKDEAPHAVNEERASSAISGPIIPVNTVAAAVAADSACLIVQVILRTASFNVTLGSDMVCPQSDGGGHSYNITYNIPLSKYMREHNFEIIFA